MFKAIDFHVHIIPENLIHEKLWLILSNFMKTNIEAYRKTCKNPDFLINLMGDEIKKTVLIAYPARRFHGLGYGYVKSIAKYCSKYPDRLLLLGGLDFTEPINQNEALEILEDQYSKLNVAGFKIHPVHQWIKPNAYREEEGGVKALEKLYQFACDHNLLVMVHTGTSVFPTSRIKYGDPIFLDDVATDFPNLKLIMSHGGRPIWMSTAFFLMRKFRNIYLDISGIPPRNLTTKYFPRLNEIADRVIYGSD